MMSLAFIGCSSDDDGPEQYLRTHYGHIVGPEGMELGAYDRNLLFEFDPNIDEWVLIAIDGMAGFRGTLVPASESEYEKVFNELITVQPTWGISLETFLYRYVRIYSLSEGRYFLETYPALF